MVLKKSQKIKSQTLVWFKKMLTFAAAFDKRATEKKTIFENIGKYLKIDEMGIISCKAAREPGNREVAPTGH
jgi:hypothetical protein